MRGKGWVICTVIILLIVTIAGVWWFNNNTGNGESLKPQVKIASINVTDIGKETIDLATSIVLTNPLPSELKTRRLDYVVFIDSTKVIKSSYSQPITINSSDSTTIKLPMQLLTDPFTNVLERIKSEGADSADYTLYASLYLDVPIAGEEKFDLKKTWRLPTYQLPKVEPGNLDIKKLGFDKSQLTMNVHVENRNPYPIEMRDVTYDLKVGNDLDVDGAIDGLTTIPGDSSATLPVELTIETGSFGELAWNALFDREDTKFQFAFTCEMISNNDMVDNSNMSFTADGTLEELRQAVKNAKE